jgi:cytoskeletal protein RodZ
MATTSDQATGLTMRPVVIARPVSLDMRITSASVVLVVPEAAVSAGLDSTAAVDYVAAAAEAVSTEAAEVADSTGEAAVVSTAAAVFTEVEEDMAASCWTLRKSARPGNRLLFRRDRSQRLVQSVPADWNSH